MSGRRNVHPSLRPRRKVIVPLRRAFLLPILGVLVAACAGSMSETEYVEELNSIASRASALFEPLVSTLDRVEEPTLADIVVFLEQEIRIRRELNEPFDALDPPESLAKVHGLLSGVVTRQL